MFIEPTDEDQVITTATARQWLGADGVVRHVIFDHVELDLEEARKNLSAIDEVAQGLRPPMVAWISGLRSVTREVRQLYGSQEAAAVVSRVALVTSRPVPRVIVKFFLALTPPPMPIRIFSNLEEGLAWVSEQP